MPSTASSPTVPVLVVVAAEDLFANEAEWLEKIARVARAASVYPAGSIGIQLRPRIVEDTFRGTEARRSPDCGARLRQLLAEVDPGERLVIYASARHPWVRARAAWRLHVPEAQLHVAIADAIPAATAWSAAVHSVAAARLAAELGAQMLLFAPVFTTTWKTTEAVGLHGLSAVTAACDIPVLALGGMQPARVAGCLDAGAAGVAVASGIMLADDVESTLGAYAEALCLPAAPPRN